MPRAYDIHHRRARRRAARLVETIEVDIESGLQLIAEHLGAAVVDRVGWCLIVNTVAVISRSRGFAHVSTMLKTIAVAQAYQERSLLEQSSRWFPDVATKEPTDAS